MNGSRRWAGAIWDDLRDSDERRAEVRGLPRPNTGTAELYSPFSANMVVRAGTGPQLITAARHVGPQNRYHPARTANFNPQMDAWYRLGAAIIHPDRRMGMVAIQLDPASNSHTRFQDIDILEMAGAEF